ncbi:glyoxal oxidase [Mycena olivaceomarginata]|nr:glyoxal oxidase [Mycena olivaceomarginata]
MRLLLPLFLVPSALAATAGSFEEVGNTLVSAMMMFLGNEHKVYIIDKAEGNEAQVAGHAAWGSVWDLDTHEATVMDISTNTFAVLGIMFQTGKFSFVTFGGNGAIGPGGKEGSVVNPGAGSASWDTTYKDFDGGQSIRVLNPCTSDDDFSSSQCQWPLGNGTIVLIGGFQQGGYILRNVPNDKPRDGAELTYEFHPSNGQTPQEVNFLVKTSGLNAYPLSWLLSSGKMFLQANLSTTIWNYEDNTESDLPDMPNGVVRVYPASAATAMLPMTPANNYSQTIIFCGGSDMPEPAWDCQRITPEPADGSPAQYIQDDDLPQGRTMGQFVILPDGKLLVLPFGQSFASGPVGTPALYDPEAAAGSRWSSAGFSTSKLARLYHSSALLLPDASVLIAGSNPNLDVNVSESVPYPTQYIAEKFYPSYFSATTRPVPSGNPFDITIPASSYSGKSDDAANNTIVSVVRSGWTTHAMNMGQRYMQLRNSYTVNKDGSIVLHVAQMEPNPNLFQPGPALLFVVVKGIPSNGTYIIIGSGAIEAQPTADASKLPENALAADANGFCQPIFDRERTSHVALIAGIAGGAAVVALLALGVGICLSRRRRARIRAGIAASKAAQAAQQPVAPYQRVDSINSSQVFLSEDHQDERPWSKPEANAWNSEQPELRSVPRHDDSRVCTPAGTL